MAKIDEKVFLSALQERFADYVPQNTMKVIIIGFALWLMLFFKNMGGK